MSKRRERKKKVGRRPSSKDPKELILIVTEGDVTEPQYLRGFAKAFRNPRVDIDYSPQSGGSPGTFVARAKELKLQNLRDANSEKDDNRKYDAIWVVCDVDTHKHMDKAIEAARDNGIKLAISNPCFELWLWLHFQDHPGHIDGKILQKSLKKHDKKYDKHVNFANYEPGYEMAVTRAKQLSLHDFKTCQPGPNPSTGVYVLTESIRDSKKPASRHETS